MNKVTTQDKRPLTLGGVGQWFRSTPLCNRYLIYRSDKMKSKVFRGENSIQKVKNKTDVIPLKPSLKVFKYFFKFIVHKGLITEG